MDRMTLTIRLEEELRLEALPEWDSPHTAIFIFGAPEAFGAQEPLKSLRSYYPRSHIIGCSTAGEIHNTNIYDQSLVLGLIRFEGTRLSTTITDLPSIGASLEAGRRIGRSLTASDLRAVILFSCGTEVNGSALVSGLNMELPGGVLVAGGLAGDGARFQQTWVINEGFPRTHSAAAIGFYGERVQVQSGSKGGWDIFGPDRKVTKSDGNTLFELDDKPALELYREYLGERSKDLPASALLFPLAIKDTFSTSNGIVRTVLGVDEVENTMTFAGDIPQDSLVQLMKANFNRLVDGAADAGRESRVGFLDDQTSLSLAISCVGRRLVLRGRTEEELEVALEALPASTELVGFYSYGEIAPFNSGESVLHNQTMTIITIGED